MLSCWSDLVHADMHGVLHHHPVGDAALLPARHTRRPEIKPSAYIMARGRETNDEWRMKNEEWRWGSVRVDRIELVCIISIGFTGQLCGVVVALVLCASFFPDGEATTYANLFVYLVCVNCVRHVWGWGWLILVVSRVCVRLTVSVWFIDCFGDVCELWLSLN